MDDRQFDSLARALVAATTTRRRVLAAGVLSGVLGMPGLFDTVAKKHKKRRKKIQRNAFGCVNVGSFCKNSGQCCSGVCQGKKGKKTCKAHDTGGCQAGVSRTVCGGEDVPCTTTLGFDGLCDTTTGNAGFCSTIGECRQGARDADCRADFGSQAACLVCADCPDGTACATPDDIV